MVDRDGSMRTATDFSLSNATAPALATTVGCISQYMHKAKLNTSESTPTRKASRALSAFGGSKRDMFANARGTNLNAIRFTCLSNRVGWLILTFGAMILTVGAMACTLASNTLLPARPRQARSVLLWHISVHCVGMSAHKRTSARRAEMSAKRHKRKSAI
jgi:hypothetical protein